MKSIDEMLDAVAKNLHAATPENVHIKKEKKPELNIVKSDPKLHSIPQYDKMTLNLAKEMAYAIEKAAEQIGVNIVIAVMDGGANLVLLHAMDGSFIASIQVAQDKAYTAAALKMPTHEALAKSRGGDLDGLTNGNGIMLIGGGEPLIKGERLFGSVGVSGGTKEQDMLLAKIGAEYFRRRIK